MQLYPFWHISSLTLCIMDTPKWILWQTVKTQMKCSIMQHNAAFHQGLHCLLRLKHPSGTEIYHNLENYTCDPLMYTMGSPILMVSICMGKSIKMKRLNNSTLKQQIRLYENWTRRFIL